MIGASYSEEKMNTNLRFKLYACVKPMMTIMAKAWSMPSAHRHAALGLRGLAPVR